ncbi:univin [Ischnura elegans]|uniref:univin n=1 Tax=Ischnura elegans TaxID=197161 RepID=UPI001ED8722D|nr:univin [Ischnura elegans]
MAPALVGPLRPSVALAALALAASAVLLAEMCRAAPGLGRPTGLMVVIEAPATPQPANSSKPSDTAEASGLQISEEDRAAMMKRVLQGMGLSKMPDVSRMNVSQEEYDRMFSVYLEAVAEGRRRHKQYYAALRDDSAEEEREPPWVVNPWLPSRRRHYLIAAEMDGDLGRNRRSLGPNDTQPTSALHLPIRVPDPRLRHRGATLRRATLRLLITAPLSVANEGLMVRLYRPAVRAGRAPILISERRVTFHSRGPHLAARWIDLDMTSAMAAWLRDPASNKGLLFECQGCSFESGPAAAARPVVDVMVGVRPRHDRFRRSYDPMTPRKRGRTDCRRGGERCCRHRMEVVFHELKGFEFILQPKKIDAGFCKGRCPPSYNPAHHHAVLQSLVWKQNRKLAPKLCCAPNKLKALEILHLDEDDPTRLKVSHWEDMEVLECACS